MPKLKRAERRTDKLTVLLAGNAKVHEKTKEELSDIMECSPGTVRNRFNDPEQLRIGEILNLGQAMNIPIEDIRAAIRY